MFRNEMAEFGNNLQVLAADEPKVIEEWNGISDEVDSDFQSLLVGTTEKIALENFIDSNLHPRFVYFSDYKKIIGNINLNEYNKERTGPSIEFSEEEFKPIGIEIGKVWKKRLQDFKNQQSHCQSL